MGTDLLPLRTYLHQGLFNHLLELPGLGCEPTGVLFLEELAGRAVLLRPNEDLQSF